MELQFVWALRKCSSVITELFWNDSFQMSHISFGWNRSDWECKNSIEKWGIFSSKMHHPHCEYFTIYNINNVTIKWEYFFKIKLQKWEVQFKPHPRIIIKIYKICIKYVADSLCSFRFVLIEHKFNGWLTTAKKNARPYFESDNEHVFLQYQ